MCYYAFLITLMLIPVNLLSCRIDRPLSLSFFSTLSRLGQGDGSLVPSPFFEDFLGYTTFVIVFILYTIVVSVVKTVEIIFRSLAVSNVFSFGCHCEHRRCVAIRNTL
jgi:hypothetical protein